MKAKKYNRDHIRWDGGGTMLCERCGNSYTMNCPVPIGLMEAAMNWYLKAHEDCEPEAEKILVEISEHG